jgi:hypothetical protein
MNYTELNGTKLNKTKRNEIELNWPNPKQPILTQPKLTYAIWYELTTRRLWSRRRQRILYKAKAIIGVYCGYVSMYDRL